MSAFFPLRGNVDFQVLFILTLSLPLLEGEVATRLRARDSTVFHDTWASKKRLYQEFVFEMIGLLYPALLRWVSPLTRSLYRNAHKNMYCLIRDLCISNLLFASATSRCDELPMSCAMLVSAWECSGHTASSLRRPPITQQETEAGFQGGGFYSTQKRLSPPQGQQHCCSWGTLTSTHVFLTPYFLLLALPEKDKEFSRLKGISIPFRCMEFSRIKGISIPFKFQMFPFS